MRENDNKDYRETERPNTQKKTKNFARITGNNKNKNQFHSIETITISNKRFIRWKNKNLSALKI